MIEWSYSENDEYFSDLKGQIESEVKNIDKTKSFKENSENESNRDEIGDYFSTDSCSYSIPFRYELSDSGSELPITEQSSELRDIDEQSRNFEYGFQDDSTFSSRETDDASEATTHTTHLSLIHI